MGKKIFYEKEFFNWNNYLQKERWVSYWHQIDEILSDASASEKCTCLVIGNGDNIVSEILMKFGIEVYTLDYSKSLEPDFCGDVREIEKILDGKKFDYVLCCQVLEHIEYKYFESILEQLSKVVNKKFIISLPQQTFNLKIHVHIPKLPNININKLFHKFWVKDFESEQHYWEIGIKNYPIKMIKNDMKKYFKIEKDYTDSINTYHHFFILK